MRPFLFVRRHGVNFFNRAHIERQIENDKEQKRQVLDYPPHWRKERHCSGLMNPVFLFGVFVCWCGVCCVCFVVRFLLFSFVLWLCWFWFLVFVFWLFV